MSFEYEPDCLGLYPNPHNFGAVQSLQFRMYVALFLELELVNKTTSNCLPLLHMVTNHFSKITRCAGFPWFFPNSFGRPS